VEGEGEGEGAGERTYDKSGVSEYSPFDLVIARLNILASACHAHHARARTPCLSTRSHPVRGHMQTRTHARSLRSAMECVGCARLYKVLVCALLQSACAALCEGVLGVAHLLSAVLRGGVRWGCEGGVPWGCGGWGPMGWWAHLLSARVRLFERFERATYLARSRAQPARTHAQAHTAFATDVCARACTAAQRTRVGAVQRGGAVKRGSAVQRRVA
jgi:hypothetical protein